MDELTNNRLAVKAGEGIHEGRYEEVRVEIEELAEEIGLSDGVREGVRDVERGRFGIGDEVREAEQADGSWSHLLGFLERETSGGLVSTLVRIQ